MAAMNLRAQPGAWAGEKGARVATAALGAAAIDAFTKAGEDHRRSGGKDSRDKNREGGDRRGQGHGQRRKSGVEELGGALGDFIADQWAKRGSSGGGSGGGGDRGRERGRR